MLHADPLRTKHAASSRTPLAPPAFRPQETELSRLQRSMGNRLFGELLAGGAGAPAALLDDVQGSLGRAQGGDAREQEADRVAADVMMPGGSARGLAHGASAARADPAGGAADPRALVAELDGRGQPLAEGLRGRVEPRVGRDLGDVRVHHDDRLVRGLGAEAFAVGRHVVIGDATARAPGPVVEGLLAHECAHVAQQASGAPAVQCAEEGWLDRAKGAWKSAKGAAYGGLIAGFSAGRNALARALDRLGVPPAITAFVDDVLADVENFVLSTVGLLVGLGEGAVGLVEAVIKLAFGILDLCWTILTGPFGAGTMKIVEVVVMLSMLDEGVKAMASKWKADFDAASPEQQMILASEATGEAIAFIGSFFIPVGAVGEAAEAAEVAARVGETAQVAGHATAAAARATEVLGRASAIARSAPRWIAEVGGRVGSEVGSAMARGLGRAEALLTSAADALGPRLLSALGLDADRLAAGLGAARPTAAAAGAGGGTGSLARGGGELGNILARTGGEAASPGFVRTQGKLQEARALAGKAAQSAEGTGQAASKLAGPKPVAPAPSPTDAALDRLGQAQRSLQNAGQRAGNVAADASARSAEAAGNLAAMELRLQDLEGNLLRAVTSPNGRAQTERVLTDLRILRAQILRGGGRASDPVLAEVSAALARLRSIPEVPASLFQQVSHHMLKILGYPIP